MSRKNSRAAKVRRHRRGEGRHPNARTHYPKLERLGALDGTVRPVGYCDGANKLKFDTEDNAAIALQQARAAHRGSGHMEERYYDCPKCDGYHLTSLKEWIER